MSEDTSAARGGCGGRSLALIAGPLLILVGIPMLICPGPGIGSILLGAGLLGYGLTGERRDRKGPGAA